MDIQHYLELTPGLDLGPDFNNNASLWQMWFGWLQSEFRNDAPTIYPCRFCDFKSAYLRVTKTHERVHGAGRSEWV